MYGLLHNMIMFYRKLVKKLEAYGYEINPYGPCVAENIINDKQMTVVWHVNYLKVLHVNRFEIPKFSGYLYSIYEGIIVHRVTVHYYLVMGLDSRN